MKKFLIVAAMIAASVSLSAQQKGDFSVGGALGVGGGSITNKWSTTAGGQTDSDKESYPSTTNFMLAPTFSYFVIDNLELSAGLEYDMTKNYTGKGSDNKNRFGFQHIAMGVIGAHYYIPLIADILYYTPGVEFGFGGGSSISQNYDGSKTTEKVPFVFAFNADLGKVEFKATDNIGVFANLLSLSVATVTYKEEDNTLDAVYKDSYTAFGANFNYGITLGVKYYF